MCFLEKELLPLAKRFLLRDCSASGCLLSATFSWVAHLQSMASMAQVEGLLPVSEQSALPDFAPPTQWKIYSSSQNYLSLLPDSLNSVSQSPSIGKYSSWELVRMTDNSITGLKKESVIGRKENCSRVQQCSSAKQDWVCSRVLQQKRTEYAELDFSLGVFWTLKQELKGNLNHISP